MSVILVYDVAASTSGALGILQSYHARALEDSRNKYIFLVSIPELESAENVEVKRFPWVKKSWLHRLIFDFFVGPGIVRDRDPDLVLSLQNTLMPRVKIPQVVYEHNSLPRPFCDISFSIFDDPNLWIRQNILGAVIVRSLKKAHYVIVQTQWMARLCESRLGIDGDRIIVEPPVIKALPPQKYRRTETMTFFYPATEMSFKNHAAIVEACRYISAEKLGCSYRVLLTLDGTESRKIAKMKSAVESEGLPIEFRGWKRQDEVYKLYSESILLFTSLLESFPLPLYEARKAEAPIIAPDLPYAREALEGYGKAYFYEAESARSLCKVMIERMCGDAEVDSA